MLYLIRWRNSAVTKTGMNLEQESDLDRAKIVSLSAERSLIEPFCELEKIAYQCNLKSLQMNLVKAQMDLMTAKLDELSHSSQRLLLKEIVLLQT